MQLQPGTLLQGDRYRIIDILGQGGFGITYLAEQVMAERKVCIKEFFPKEYYNRDEDSRSISLGSQGSAEIMELYKAKFIKEAKTIAKLDHPNIIHIHDVFAENNTAYYVMEYIDGESLSALVKERGALPESEAIGYIKQVAAALGSIHEQRIMHLDIKPANVMLRKEDGRAVLIDFGLSKQYDAEGNQTSSTPVGISAGYAPMEQYQQGGVKEFSPETDIYSLGATLYYLVTGVVPPQAATIVDEGLPELPTHLSANVRNAIERSMEVQRKRRPHSIKEFLALLEDNNPVVVPIPTPVPTPVPTPTSAPVSATADDKTSVAASALVTDDRTVVSTPAPKAQPTPQPKKEWTPKYSTEKPKKSDEPKKKSKWWLWLLIIVVVAIGGYLALSSSNDSETAKSEQVQNRQTEEAEKARIAEEKRQAEETEKARKAEEKRKAEEAEEARKAEEKRQAEEAEKARIVEEKRQAEEAEKARKAEEKRKAEEAAKQTNFVESVNGVSFKMIWVDGGTFAMGSDDFDSSKPVHQVTLDGYWIAETEVTQALWEAVMGTTVEQQRDKTDNKTDKSLPLKGTGDNYPMYYVSYNDALDFCKELNMLTGNKYKFTLPTEAQWEFAARGGNKSNDCKYSGSTSIDKVAWYGGNSGSKTHEVKGKNPNELGLYDMSGNMCEWCLDWYSSSYYYNSPSKNPQGPSSGAYHVLRGGGWYSDAAADCRVAYRGNYGVPDCSDWFNGFRLVALPR